MRQDGEGTITQYDPMDQLGTIAATDGRSIRFSVSACPEFFRPEPGTAVIFSDVVKGFAGRDKAKVVQPKHQAVTPLVKVLERRDGAFLPQKFPAAPSRSVKETWSMIARWVEAQDSALLDRLAPGASPSELEQLTNHLGMELPSEFVAFWTERNGSQGKSYLFQGLDFYPVARMVGFFREAAEWDPGDGTQMKTHGLVKPLWCSGGWIPIACLGGSSEYLCLDLDPPEGGRRGQLIHVPFKWSERTVVCAGVACLFEAILTDLESGEYYLSER